VSGSVNPRFGFEQQAATNFLRQIMRPGDTVLILALSAEPHLLQPRTYSLASALKSLETLEPTRGMTAFFDTIVLGSHLLRQSASPESRRVEVVFSDGEDNNSTNQLPDTLRELQRADCIFYSINPTGPSVRLNQMSQKGQEIMVSLAGQTGGTAFLPSSEQEFTGIFSRIAAELQAQYLLGYYSSDTATDGSFRRIIVNVPQRPDLRIRARQGYYAPKA
jgi:VWFA-related protein